MLLHVPIKLLGEILLPRWSIRPSIRTMLHLWRDGVRNGIRVCSGLSLPLTKKLHPVAASTLVLPQALLKVTTSLVGTFSSVFIPVSVVFPRIFGPTMLI